MKGRELKNAILYGAFTFLRWLSRSLPESWVYWLGRGIGLLAFGALPDRRRVAEANLVEALHLSSEEAWKLARRTFTNLGLMGVEFLRFAGRRDQIKERVAFVGRENLDQAFALGRGVVLLLPHLGNWELLGQAIAFAGYPVHPVFQVQDNSRFNDLIDRLRRQSGMLPIPRGFSLREILRVLRGGGCVPIVPDQDAGWQGVFVPFFGRPASCARGISVVPIAAGAPVVPAYIRRINPGHHELCFLPPLELNDSGDREADTYRNLLRVNQVVERIITAYPDQWLWMHKRWKTQPRTETEESGRDE